MAYTTDELMAEISEHWARDPDSNNYKLAQILAEEMQKISENILVSEEQKEISKAEGYNLDMLGKDRSVPRISNDDDFYRFLIKIRAMMSRSTGSSPNITEIISTAINSEDKVRIIQTQPHHIAITIPSEKLPDVKQQRILIDNLQDLVALGNWLDSISWEIAGITTLNYACSGTCSEIV